MFPRKISLKKSEKLSQNIAEGECYNKTKLFKSVKIREYNKDPSGHLDNCEEHISEEGNFISDKKRSPTYMLESPEFATKKKFFK